MKTSQLTAFSSRFSFSDWSFLCSHSDFSEAAEKGDLDKAEMIARRILANNGKVIVFQPAKEMTELEALNLRGKDRIEGEEVVIVFKKNREVRLGKNEWISICTRNAEPHSIAALRIK